MTRAPGNNRKAIRRFGKTVVGVATVLLLTAATLFSIVPIIWAILTSLKTPREVALYPPTFFPKDLTFENYLSAVFYNATFLHYLFNTVCIVAVATVLCLFCASHAAHAVARYRFRGSSVLMLAMFSTIMIPGVAVVIPLYLLSIKAGIYDTVLVLILVYSAWLTPTLVWLLRGFIIAIPWDPLESTCRHASLSIL